MTKTIKRISITTFMAICFAVTCLVLTGCGSKNATFSSSADAFGFAGATAGAFLSGLDSSASSVSPTASNAPTADQQKNVEIINKYIDIFDSVVGNNAIVSKKEHIDNDPNYNYKLTTTITNLDGSKQEFVMKFKEVKKDNTWVTDDDDDEIESTLTGVMTYAGNDYEIKGKKTVEEDEVEIEFVAYLNESIYVKVEQETENGEQEFQYEIWENGVVIDSTSIEVETERDEIEVEMEYSKGGETSTYKFEREGNQLKIYYRDSNGSGYIKARVSNNGDTIIYTLEDGSTIERAR